MTKRDLTSLLPKPRDHVLDHNLASAEDFLRCMSPLSEPWAEAPTAWVYRGQANADWELRARAVRDGAAFKEFHIDGDSSRWPQRKLRFEETLARFRRGLDDSGLVVPARSPYVHMLERAEPEFAAEPLREAWPLMALAQHHGLPTPFLDWSRRALVAAYFAASTSFGLPAGTSTHLAVWCLRIDRGVGNALDMMRRTAGHLQTYVAPGGANPNLRAQAGLFTYLWGEDDPSLEGHIASCRRDNVQAPELQRVTLPVAHAGKLLRLLANEGVHGASMFPGADGIVRAMREEAWWCQTPVGASDTALLPARPMHPTSARASAKAAPAPKAAPNRDRRLLGGSPRELAKALAQVVTLLKKEKGGLSLEQLRAKMSMQKLELSRVVKEGLERKVLKTGGERRLRRYSVA